MPLPPSASIPSSIQLSLPPVSQLPASWALGGRVGEGGAKAESRGAKAEKKCIDFRDFHTMRMVGSFSPTLPALLGRNGHRRRCGAFAWQPMVSSCRPPKETGQNELSVVKATNDWPKLGAVLKPVRLSFRRAPKWPTISASLWSLSPPTARSGRFLSVGGKKRPWAATRTHQTVGGGQCPAGERRNGR